MSIRGCEDQKGLQYLSQSDQKIEGLPNYLGKYIWISSKNVHKYHVSTKIWINAAK